VRNSAFVFSNDVIAMTPNPKIDTRGGVPSQFLCDYRPAHAAALRASASIGYALQTTALTAHDAPTSVTKNATIGPGVPWWQYQRQYAATLDCRPRARVLSLQLATGEVLLFDLDGLTPAAQAELVRDCLHQRTVVGHDLAPAFAWSLAMATDWRPARVLDTLLLVRALLPNRLWQLHRLAASGHAGAAALIAAHRGGDAPASLAAVCLSLGLEPPEPAYQAHRHWCVSHLSQSHADYVRAVATAPLQVLDGLTGEKDVAAAVAALIRLDTGSGGSYFGGYEQLPYVLAQLHQRGLPVHRPTVAALLQQRVDRLPALAATVVQHLPDLVAYPLALQTTKLAVAAAVQSTLAAYAQAHGFQLDTDARLRPLIGAKSAKRSGAASLPGWQAWEQLQQARRDITAVGEWADLTGPDERVRPLFTPGAVTLRLTAQAPNSMAAPRASGELGGARPFRSVLRARDGHAIVFADYPQFELRIVAAAAQCAMALARAVLAGDGTASPWVIGALRRGETTAPLLRSAAGDWSWEDGLANAWRAVRARGTPLAAVLRAGLDPHLLTACMLAAQQGVLDLAGADPLPFLQQHPDRVALQATLRAQRQAAKAVNFGLLYGMQSTTLHAYGIVKYGLTWEPATAKAARQAWFELFPEIDFWQRWLRHVDVAPKVAAICVHRHNPFRHGQLEAMSVRLRNGQTLSGRPVCAAEAHTLMNYVVQGTAADLLMRAIVSLPEPAQSYLINAVHDELLLEVPRCDVELAKVQLKTTMEAAAATLLAPYGIPVAVAVTVSDSWAED
jgi:hypothetical protein